MASDKKANTDISLHNWRSTILPEFLFLPILFFLPALAAEIIAAIANLGAVGFLQLFDIPIIIFPLPLSVPGILLPILTRNHWLGLTTIFMLLTTGITLRILFIHYQEQGKESEVLEKEQLPCG